MYITFIIIFISTLIGSMTGLGGGVIIKPLLSVSTNLPVVTTNFFSSTAILFMCSYSLFTNRKSSDKIDFKIAYTLSIGAFIGGIVGSKVLLIMSEYLRDSIILNIQLVMLILVMLISVAVTLSVKETSRRDVKLFVVVLIGIISGMLSSYLGIGGGIINIPILLLVFKKTPKQAVITSLVIVFVSQIATLFTFIVDGILYDVKLTQLITISFAGIFGGIVGKKIFSVMSSRTVRILYVIVLSSLIIINIIKII